MPSTHQPFDDDGHRRVDPLHGEGPLYGKKRAALQQRCAALADRLTEMDRQLATLARERRHVAGELKQHRRRLWPKLALRGRAPAVDGGVQLPPLPKDVSYLWGRRLRSSCRAILALLGEASLAELHAMLHRLGYAVSSRTPVKALADALGYDADDGQLVRVRRGVYAPVPGSRPPRHLWRGGPPLGPLPAVDS